MNQGHPQAKVGIFGSYGYWNHGDEAILASIIRQLRGGPPVEITVFSQNVEVTNRLHQVEKAVPVSKLTRDELLPEVQDLDLLIVGGGGILFDEWITRHFGVEALALERGIPIMLYGVGAGPLEAPKSIELARALVEGAQMVTVRDRASKQTLEKIGISREILVTGDAALLMEPEPLPEGLFEREGIISAAPLVGISLREPGGAAPGMEVEHYHRLVASAADFIVERYGANLLFIPMEPHTQDLQHSHAVIAQMHQPQHAAVLQGEYRPGQILTLMSRLRFAVGMRLHFLIFAALQGVPFVALPYASKVSGFIESLGLPAPALQNITTGQFLAYVDRTWDFQKEMRAQISKGIEPLRAGARLNPELAQKLLQG